MTDPVPRRTHPNAPYPRPDGHRGPAGAELVFRGASRAPYGHAIRHLTDHVPTDAARDLVACPKCDALQRAAAPPAGGRVRCVRCGTVLIAAPRLAVGHVLMLSASVLVLMWAVVTLPFISIHASGLANRSSVLDAALAFAGGPMAALAIAVLALIVLIPAVRSALLIYALAPLALGRRPWPRARAAFALDEDLKPWSMAEIFVIGVAVALVKIADLATVELGPAFWLFGALVLVSALQDNGFDRWTIWKALSEDPRT